MLSPKYAENCISGLTSICHVVYPQFQQISHHKVFQRGCCCSACSNTYHEIIPGKHLSWSSYNVSTVIRTAKYIFCMVFSCRAYACFSAYTEYVYGYACCCNFGYQHHYSWNRRVSVGLFICGAPPCQLPSPRKPRDSY
jgi:hypothetical protein